MGETIRRLRIKTTALITVMVGVVLASILIVEYLNAYDLHEKLISESLHGHMDEASGSRFQMGQSLPDGSSSQDGAPPRRSSIFMGFVIVISDDGTVISASGDSIDISTEGLSSIVRRVLAGEGQGRDADTDLAWISGVESDGSIRIAIVDISSSREAMARQGCMEVVMFALSIGAVAGMAWVFSDSATQPIAEAWEGQRRFVADASHELKTPLAVIKANMSVIRKDGSVGEDAGRWVESTIDEADRMSGLIADMLELARTDENPGIARGGRKDGMVEVDLSQLAEEAAMEMDAIAFERGHVIEEDIEDSVMVVGNAEKLSRLARILIDNATKYAGVGSPISVSVHATKRHVRLSVHNDGNPIPAEDLPHVFDRFYRSDKARTADENKSFGLGLPIAKGIAESHGGRLTVESSESDGTTFTLMLHRKA